MFCLGQMVYSKNGRDKGKAFLIVGIEGEYLLLADGKGRTLEKPKRKKAIHVQRVNRADPYIKARLENGEYLQNSDLKSSLRKLCNEE